MVLLEKNSSGIGEGSVEGIAGGKMSDLGSVGGLMCTSLVRVRCRACMRFV